MDAGLLAAEPVRFAASPLRAGAATLEVLLVNNASATAFDRVGRQFGMLLDAASGSRPVRLHVASLPGSSRAARPGQTVPSVWALLDEVPVDAIVVTGAEPTGPDLRDEPFWPDLAALFGWAERHGTPMILSCLAAHAAVLHASGVRRTALPRKCFGVFREETVAGDGLLRGVAGPVLMPHSRWNAVGGDALAANGYRILTWSDEAGVGSFVGDRGWLHFQGHPEYEATSLLAEYRRDVARHSRGELALPPDPPVDRAAPADTTAASPAAWRPAGSAIVANWLGGVRRESADGPADAARS